MRLYRKWLYRKGPKSKSPPVENEEDAAAAGWLMISHKSWLYNVWWHIMLVLALLTVVMLPLHLSFYPERGIGTFLTVVDGLFVLDILISFRRTHTDPITTELVIDGRLTALYYLNGSFIADLLAVLPFDQLVRLDVADSGTYDPRSLALLGYLRFLRMRRVMSFFSRLELNERVSYGATCIIKFLLVLLLNAHTAGCSMWFLASLRNFGSDTWIGDPNIEMQSVPQQYAMAFYWAVTSLTTVGYGDFSPASIEERLFGSCYMLLNLAVTAWIIGTVTLLATKGEEDRAFYRRELRSLYRYAKANDLPPKLISSMKAYINLQSVSSYVNSADFELKLPSFLSAKARNLRHRPVLSRVPLLADTSDVYGSMRSEASCNEINALDDQQFSGQRNRFLTALTARMQEAVLMDGVRLFEAGDIAQDVWVILNGNAEVVVPASDGSEVVVETAGVGGVLGAESFFSGLDMPWAVRVAGVTRALKLTESDRDALFDAFTDQERRIFTALVRNMESRQTKVDGIVATLRASRFRDGVALRKQTKDSSVHGRSKDSSVHGRSKDSSVHGPSTDSSVHGVHHTSEVAPEAKKQSARVRSMGRLMALAESSALSRYSSLCGTMASSLKAQKAKREQALSATLCDLASKNLVPELRRLLRNVDARSVPADYDGRTALHLAAAHGNLEVIQFLAEEGCNLTAVDRFGRTPLFEAALNQHTECITLLKSLGASLHVPPSTQASLLCGATSCGDASLLRMLLLAGANPASGDYDGRTAIHLAACTGSEVLAQLLLDYLDTEETPIKKIKDRWGHTPVDDARERGFVKVVELFKAHDTCSSSQSSRSGLAEPETKKNPIAMLLMGAGL